MSDKKAIKREVIYLYIIQISNMLLPLATFPYLARVLGAEFFWQTQLRPVHQLYRVVYCRFWL
ncbi:hypothetical protein [Dickeya solani]|uniref:hypothetical protein n=1 Tax=Dickeya solani TaxID=1089444 RepID=UPI0003A8DB0C|nr:hypothetical protein [Dickeya solani]